MYVCMYVYIYIYTHRCRMHSTEIRTYIHTYIHTHTQAHNARRQSAKKNTCVHATVIPTIIDPVALGYFLALGYCLVALGSIIVGISAHLFLHTALTHTRIRTHSKTKTRYLYPLSLTLLCCFGFPLCGIVVICAIRPLAVTLIHMYLRLMISSHTFIIIWRETTSCLTLCAELARDCWLMY